MKNYGFSYNKRKIFVFLFMACILLLLYAVFNKPPTVVRDPLAVKAEYETDLKSPVSFKAEMPAVSSYGYMLEEFKLLNTLVSKGLMINEYRKDFLNKGREDYDIEARYSDFVLDIEQYKREIKRTIDAVKELRPDSDQAKIKQQETLDKLIRLYSIVGEYKDHIRLPKETAAYLKDCAYTLRRVEDQAQLP